VLQAADGDSAINHLKNKEPIQVVMLDVEMPSWQSVFAFAREKVSVPIILGMGNLHVLDTQQLGFDEYLSKPLEFNNVCGTISRLMTGIIIQKRT
jgi:DNA-binding response OmpR family regulator